MGLEEDWQKEKAEQKRLAEIDNNFNILIQKMDVSVAFEKKYFGNQSAPEPINRILPDAAETSGFIEGVREYNFYTTTFDNQTRTLTFNAHGKKMQVTADGVIELLSDKFELPVPKTEGAIKSKPPFIENLDKIINEKLSWAQAEFNQIIALGDPKIKKICNDFYRMQSYPLLVRIKYMEWEKTVADWNVQKIIVKLNDELSLKTREIQKDYNDKLTNEKKTLVFQIDKLQKEVMRLRNLSDTVTSLHQNALTEISGFKQEIENLVEKTKMNDETLMKYQAENIEFRTLLKQATEKVDKYEAIGWAPDFASTEEHPVFCNSTDGKIIKFPCSMKYFKTDYIVGTSDGEQRVYTAEGKDNFIIPESLAFKLPSLLAPPTSKEPELEKKKMKSTEEETQQEDDIKQITIDILSEFPNINATELAKKAGITNIDNYRHRTLRLMVESGQVLKNKDKTYSLNSNYGREVEDET